jgi:hypothetical protein
MRVQKCGDWLAAKVGDDLVMMSAKEGNYIGLNEVGSRIWELIEEPCEIDDLCAQLESEFQVSRETCVAEVQSFLKELESHGAVAFIAPPA